MPLFITHRHEAIGLLTSRQTAIAGNALLACCKEFSDQLVNAVGERGKPPCALSRIDQDDRLTRMSRDRTRMFRPINLIREGTPDQRGAENLDHQGNRCSLVRTEGR